MENNRTKIFTTIRRLEGDAYYSELMGDYFTQIDRYHFDGTLIFQGNTNDIDPWVMAQELFVRSKFPSPFVAVNPIYMHPYTAAKKIFSFAKLYQRKVYLNFITGTSISDLDSLDGLLSHEERYNRLIEYIQIIWHLLTTRLPLTYDGKFYKTKNLFLPGSLNQSLLPEMYIAGSSVHADRARACTNSGKLQMAKPVDEIPASENGLALHFGIIACNTNQEAREKLQVNFGARFSETSEILEASMQNTDSTWKQDLIKERDDEIFTIEPFKNLTADCPYLVGSYSQVAQYLQRYIEKGSTLFVVEAGNNDLADLNQVIGIINSLTKIV